MLDSIIEIDQSLLLYLNGIHSPFFDVIMWWISQVITWVPFYTIVAFLLIKNLGLKNGIFSILCLVLVVALADQISVKLFKYQFERPRPTHDDGLKSLVHIVNEYRGGMYGFVSSHAANSFGIAVFIGLILKKFYAPFLLIAILWASIVSYSRIYLGVHYPLDIICGGILGGTIGYSIYKLYHFISKKYII